jgi:aspartyl protease family protein
VTDAWAAILAAALLAGTAHGQTVTLNGSMGDRAALLVIDGHPHTVAVGVRVQGVKLLSLAGSRAEVEVAGKRVSLAIGTPVRLAGSAAPASGSEITLPAGPGGHFYANGSINGRPVRFVVDTGATSVALSQADAERIGIDWRRAPTAMGQTANGAVPMQVVMLSAVRIGDVEVPNVQAVVVPGSMPFVLLGNSFLARFQLRQENDILRLQRR